MPTYILTNTLSDVANTRLMFVPQNNSTSLALSVTTTPQNVDFITPVFYPNNSNVTTTSSTLVVSHSVTNMNVILTATLIRVNSVGTAITLGTTTIPTTPAATNTFANIDDPTWGATCSDRLLVRLTYVASMGTQNTTLTLDSNTSYLNSTIPQNSSTCQVLRKIDLSI